MNKIFEAKIELPVNFSSGNQIEQGKGRIYRSKKYHTYHDYLKASLEDMLDNLTRGNYASTRVGDTVKLMLGYNHGTIDRYDNSSNGAGIVEGRYGMIWYNAGSLLNK
ncbi:hypothetical protein [Weissella hellenica]|uniref:hypothetical protein n=1 Tax=Weissella hellenica TaxID=46256 RepID=UPI003888BEA1